MGTSLIKHLVWSAFIFFTELSLNAAPIKALLITGGCCHDYDTQRDIIPMAIDNYSKEKVAWTILHQRTKKGDILLEFYKNPDWAKGYDVVVHNECFADIDDEDYVQGILKPHLDGVPAVLIHCSMHSYRTGPAKEDWWKFCGAHSPGHGPKHPFEVKITEPGHEIMEGMSNWTTPNGELYFVEKEYPTMTTLAESISKKNGESHSNIWVNNYGPNETRVFATTIGHHNETMLDKNYMEMITRGFLWATGRPVAENLKSGS
ncbi:ThuA domain-containing protein [Rubellicoccus peritrichatus]|uniref:ThuA domain-containing protein n=1 Tax=Rubellicoccus peritrichatus TaxID=3080537 RepID=A0AAQ3LFF6_9BACT|nr:ThuA domain-containing protein [Puniceicoccus sp. CR14]WOO43732.1 ThuA domain-containing protein [Puniceicoccus sp. CR14]